MFRLGRFDEGIGWGRKAVSLVGVATLANTAAEAQRSCAQPLERGSAGGRKPDDESHRCQPKLPLYETNLKTIRASAQLANKPLPRWVLLCLFWRPCLVLPVVSQPLAMMGLLMLLRHSPTQPSLSLDPLSIPCPRAVPLAGLAPRSPSPLLSSNSACLPSRTAGSIAGVSPRAALVGPPTSSLATPPAPGVAAAAAGSTTELPASTSAQSSSRSALQHPSTSQGLELSSLPALPRPHAVGWGLALTRSLFATGARRRSSARPRLRGAARRPCTAWLSPLRGRP